MQESHIPAKGDRSTAHVMLVDSIIGNSADCRETLKFLRMVKFKFWGIKKDPVSSLHPLEGRGFAMVRLDESTSDASLKMILRCNYDPVFHLDFVFLLYPHHIMI
jgi:hypothetical protein